MSLPSSEVTSLLVQVQEGQDGAWDRLITRVHAELRGMAHNQFRKGGDSSLLQTTALVNECWIRLGDGEAASFENRAHFFSAAATAMRRVLVDEARRRHAAKRGEGGLRLSITEAEPFLADQGKEWGALEEVELVDLALERFASHPTHAKHSKVVELRYFAGLTIEESARVLGVAPATVKRDWDYARAWLRREILRMSRDPA